MLYCIRKNCDEFIDLYQKNKNKNSGWTRMDHRPNHLTAPSPNNLVAHTKAQFSELRDKPLAEMVAACRGVHSWQRWSNIVEMVMLTCQDIPHSSSGGSRDKPLAEMVAICRGGNSWQRWANIAEIVMLTCQDIPHSSGGRSRNIW